MARWFDELTGLFRRPRPRRPSSGAWNGSTDSPALFDAPGGSYGASDNPPDVSPSDSSESFEHAFDGGESGGGGASADYGGGYGGDSGGGGDAGGGGGDGGGGGGGGD